MDAETERKAVVEFLRRYADSDSVANFSGGNALIHITADCIENGDHINRPYADGDDH